MQARGVPKEARSRALWGCCTVWRGCARAPNVNVTHESVPCLQRDGRVGMMMSAERLCIPPLFMCAVHCGSAVCKKLGLSYLTSPATRVVWLGLGALVHRFCFFHDAVKRKLRRSAALVAADLSYARSVFPLDFFLARLF